MKIIAELEVEAERIKELIEHLFSHDAKTKININPDVGGGQVPPPPPGG